MKRRTRSPETRAESDRPGLRVCVRIPSEEVATMLPSLLPGETMGLLLRRLALSACKTPRKTKG